MPNILINPESGFLEFNTGSASGSAFDTSLSGAARLKFENSGELNLTSLGTGVADKFSIDGSNGRLLTVNNTVTGSIFSVNDVAGLPIVEVFSDDRVVMGQYATDALVVSGSDVSFANLPTISGQTFITGFAEGDTLQTVTDRGATTTNALALNNGVAISKAAQGILSASRSDAGTATFSLSATNGDTQITFQNLAASKFTLGNDGTNNSFRISEGATLGTNDRFVILNGGDVGIGTNAPLGTTHIYTADAGGAIATNASHDDLIIENNGNCGIQLSSPANSYQYLAFGDTASANQGYVRYYHDNNSMTLRAGGTDTLTLSGAKVGIGTAVPSDKLHVWGSVRGDLKLEGNYQGGATDVGKFTYAYAPRGGDHNNRTIASISAYNTTTDSTAGGYLSISTRATDSTNQERIRVNQDGQVDIYGNASFAQYLYHKGDEDTNIKFNTDEVIIHAGDVTFFRATETTQNTIKLNSDFADTDFYLYGNDGTPALFMRGSDRQIGINTASPTHALHIDNDGNTLPAKILIDSTTTADASIEFSHNGTYGFIMGSDESDRFFKISSGNALGTNDRFVIDTAGNVGIGTAAPQKKEHIYFNGNDGLRIESTNNHAFTQIMAHNSYSAYIQFRDSSNRYWLECKSDDTLQFRPNATSSDDNKVTFDAIGQVGVGITSPAAKLQVYTSANRHTKILGSTADLEVISDNNTNPIALIKGIGTADLLNVFDNTTEVFTILDGGDVGVGSASPSTKLDVGGIATADALRARAGNINYNLITRNDAAYSLYVQASQSAAQQQIASFRYGNGAAGQGTEVLSVKRGVSYFNETFLGIGKAGADTALDVNGVTTSLGFHTSTANTTYALLSRDSAGNSPLYVQSANSNTNQPIAFFSYGSASANAGTKVLKVGKDISYFDNTDVGIGTVSPQTRLTVEDALHPLDVNRTDGSSALIQLRTQGGIRGYLGASSTDSFSVWNSTPTRLFTVRNGGNVGINVSDPDEKLEVAGKTHLGDRGQDGGARILYASLSETTAAAATLLGNAVYAGTASSTYRKTYNDAGNFIRMTYNKGICFHTNVTGNAGSAEYPIAQHEQVRIDLDGNVGIGTDNPSNILHVRAEKDGDFVARMTNTEATAGANYGLKVDGGSNASDKSFVVSSYGGTEYLTIRGDGNVGIGNSSPGDKLSVKGGMSDFETTLTNNYDWQNSPISILERDNVSATQSADKYSPNLNFHWGSRVSNSLWMGADGRLNWGSYSSLGIPASDGTFQCNGIILVGAGRIQGVDTVTDSTDAANKAYVDSQVATSDTLQEVTDNGSTTTNNMEIQGAGSKSFTVDSTDGHASVVIDRHSTSYDANLSFQTNGATKWRLWNDSNDSTFSIRDEVNASNVMTWEVGGNIGIGTDDPDGKLHIETAASSQTASTQADELIVENSTHGGISILTPDASRAHLYFNQGAFLRWQSSLFTIDTSNSAHHLALKAGGGNVGIGTNSPTQALEVHSTIKIGETAVAGGRLISADSMIFQIDCDNTSSTSSYRFRKDSTVDAGTELMRIQEDGKVGIGTNNPAAQLEVQQAAGSPMMQLRPNAASTALNPLILYRSQVEGSANYMLCEGTSTYFGTYHGGVPTDKSEMIRILPSSADAPSLRIGDAGSAGANLQVGGNVYLSNNSTSYINGGNVGIGTNDPQANLHIFKTEGGVGAKHATIRMGGYLGVGPEIAAYRVDGNSNNQGLIFSTNDATDGLVDVLTMNNDGRVGIGSSDPASRLDINNGAGGSSETLLNVGGTGNGRMLVRHIDGKSATSASAQALYLNYVSNSIVSIAYGGGNVGIGTHNPSFALDVETSDNTVASFVSTTNKASIIIQDDTTLGYFSAENDIISIGAAAGANANNLCINQNNNRVGIGTNVPGALLDIRGDMRLDSGGNTDRSIYFRNQSSEAKVRSDASLQFDVGVSSSPSAAMYIAEDTRNVGIGTTTPPTSAKVSIQANNTNEIHTGLCISSYQSTAGTAGNGVGIVMGQDNGVYSSKIANVWTNNNPSYLQTNIAFYTMHDSYARGSETEKMRLTSQGRLGIGVTNPSQSLEVVTNTDASAQIGRAHIGYVGFADHAGFAHLDNASTSNYSLLQSSAGDTFINSAASRHIYFRDGNATIGGFNSDDDFYVDTDTLYVDASAGSVCIGITDPSTAKLRIKGTTNDNSALTLQCLDSTNAQTFFVRNDGVVQVTDNYFYVSSTAGAYVENTLRVRGSIDNDYGTLAINGDVNFDSNTMFVDSTNNRVGIGITSPSYDLHVEGEILAESNMLLGGDGTYGSTYGAIGIGTTNLTNGHHRIFAKSSDHMYFAAATSKGFRFRADGGSAVDGKQSAITSAGNLGVGTITASSKLAVNGGVAIGASYVGNSAPSNGAIIQGNVGIGTSSVSYALQVNGSIVGSYKSFLIDHPTKEGKQLMHSCIEGPEHAVYFRGKSNLNVIKMPDYWEGLVDLNTMTVELTAIGANQNIYVDSIAENGEVTVGSNTDEPLNYFYVVYGERKDIDKLEIEIVKPQYAD
jgi:hypothetical protein